MSLLISCTEWSGCSQATKALHDAETNVSTWKSSHKPLTMFLR